MKKNQNKMITTLLDNRTGNRTEVEPVVEGKDNSSHDEALESACHKLMAGIERKSIQDIRDALREAYQCLEGQSSEEPSNPSDVD